jgi:hypothetical protein
LAEVSTRDEYIAGLKSRIAKVSDKRLQRMLLTVIDRGTPEIAEEWLNDAGM